MSVKRCSGRFGSQDFRSFFEGLIVRQPGYNTRGVQVGYRKILVIDNSLEESRLKEAVGRVIRLTPVKTQCLPVVFVQ